MTTFAGPCVLCNKRRTSPLLTPSLARIDTRAATPSMSIIAPKNIDPALLSRIMSTSRKMSRLDTNLPRLSLKHLPPGPHLATGLPLPLQDHRALHRLRRLYQIVHACRRLAPPCLRRSSKPFRNQPRDTLGHSPRLHSLAKPRNSNLARRPLPWWVSKDGDG